MIINASTTRTRREGPVSIPAVPHPRKKHRASCWRARLGRNDPSPKVHQPISKGIRSGSARLRLCVTDVGCVGSPQCVCAYQTKRNSRSRGVGRIFDRDVPLPKDGRIHTQPLACRDWGVLYHDHSLARFRFVFRTAVLFDFHARSTAGPGCGIRVLFWSAHADVRVLSGRPGETGSYTLTRYRERRSNASGSLHQHARSQEV